MRKFISFFMRLFIFFVLIAYIGVYASSQTAYQHISDRMLYGFLDELAAVHVIEINSVVKPYSRTKIASWLVEANLVKDGLSAAQRAKLDMYLREFAMERGELKTGGGRLWGNDSDLSVHLLPPEVVWRDSLLRVIMRPVYGLRRFEGSDDGFFHTPNESIPRKCSVSS